MGAFGDWYTAAVAFVFQSACIWPQGCLCYHWPVVDHCGDRHAPSWHHILVEKEHCSLTGIDRGGTLIAQ